jgi:NAD(P)-dependent dehydrogenase (short-subunit alcohol dehydrogenase family)
MVDNFNNKVAVITGGATGIGFALAKALGKLGAKIIIGEPRADKLQAAVAQLGKLNIEAASFVMDVSNFESVEALADFAWQQYGAVDLLFNNAGISMKRGSVTKANMDDVRRVFDVNFFGIWHGCAIFGKRMIEQGTPAAIYNTASENALFTAVPKTSAYVASKHAVLGFTESFREEMPDFIQVGTIIPGFVQSDLIDPSIVKLAMGADRFADIVIEQIKAGSDFIVSHSFNVEHINQRHTKLMKAYQTFAPRYDGDEEFDVPTLIAQFTQKPANEK